MPMEDFDIAGSYGRARYDSMSAERSVNLYLYVLARGKKQKIMLPTPGLTNSNFTFPSVSGTDGVRGTFVFGANLYVVIGSVVFLISAIGVISQLGVLTTTSGYVGIDANTHQVIFVDGVKGYTWNTLTTTFAQITDSNFPAQPIDVCYLGGFMFVASGSTNTFVQSQFDDARNYTPLSQGALSSHPGTIVACKTLHGRVFFFSQNFTEVWELSGQGGNLAVRKNTSIVIEFGTPSIGSVVSGLDRLFFLSQDRDGLGPVMEIQGLNAVPVSTPELDFELQRYASSAPGVSDARGLLIRDNGIIFYRLNFTAANHTWVFNVTFSDSENLNWHEEELLNGSRHPAQTHAYFNGLNYYGHYSKPILYVVSPTYFTNDGEAIRRMRIPKPIVPPGYQRIRCDRYQLDLVQGNVALLNIVNLPENLLAETGSDILTESGLQILLEQTQAVEEIATQASNLPQVFLALSKDGGQTYGYERTAPMGRLGQRSARTLWRKLGTIPRGQSFQPRIQFFDPVPFVILGASWFYEILPE